MIFQIRRGVTRIVLVTKKYAIKVPRLYDCKGHKAWSFVRGWAANMSEWDWTNYEGAEVCPVIKSYFGSLINVYPKCRVATEEEAELNYPKMRFKTPSDTKASNFGWYKGKFVWLDYDMNWNDCRKCSTVI